MAPPAGTTGTQLSRGRWMFAFALVTSLFFTWGFAYGLLDVLNSHFQKVFGISKLQSTMLQLAYFGAYLVYAPIAGVFMRRYGYKKGIHMGLGLYSLGAIFFWPSAKFEKYGGFVGSTFVIGCGLATLEVAANSYIAVLGSPKYAAARLNFSQGFQGVASFAGPLIASRWFFQGKNATTLDTVQWVYLAVAGLGLVLNILFYFCALPEITEDALEEEMHGAGMSKEQEPFSKQYRCIFGWVAQTCYVGAQVGVASFVVNFLDDQGLGITQSHASTLFSICQITFTIGRFTGVAILNFIDPALLLSLYGMCCIAFSIGVSQTSGWGGVACLFCLFFFESICYPCVFTIGTKNLGVHTKRGSGLIVMGVGGGAWYPPAQGGLADNVSTRASYLVPMTGYIVMTIYALGIVGHQAVEGGFRIRNVDELAVERAPIAEEFPPTTMPDFVAKENYPDEESTPPSETDKNADEEYVEDAKA
ncbi:MFS general substrate transporter [Neolentinus lepideus HHB14362 ss-1]|uniref:MFS general substrate transporter n=1 Tax=Neolentinus lepideus HHB14362 ss-1 TaxID=1314782 RepID=A0A165TKY1_9AGAM|nr:MFS general substrate transporter [Neolentinus lepideus HHB14362 ss-1]